LIEGLTSQLLGRHSGACLLVFHGGLLVVQLRGAATTGQGENP